MRNRAMYPCSKPASTGFGERLRSARISKEMGTRDLSRATGVDTGYLSRWETKGLHAKHPVYNLIKVCKVLNISLGFLLEGKE